MEESLGILNDLRFAKALLSFQLFQRGLGNVTDAWAATVARHPHKTALITCGHGGTTTLAPPGDAWQSGRFNAITFQQLDMLSNQAANVLLRLRGSRSGGGHTIALMMVNSIQFVACWLGATKIGTGVAFLNTNLQPTALAHAISIVAPYAVICDGDLAVQALDALRGTSDAIRPAVCVWEDALLPPRAPTDDAPLQVPTGVHLYPRIATDVASASAAPIPASHRAHVTLASPWGYVYTSGTTGLPKSATITHQRFIMAGMLLGNVAGVRADDIIYCALPLYHSAGGMVGLGNVISRGCTFVITRKFSASRFWPDVAAHGATVIQYIGELCRFLVGTRSVPEETAHKVRLALGNGLRPDVWDKFQDRFRIPIIVEFYASTEGNATLINVCTKAADRGAVGRYGVIARSLGLFRLAKYDDEKEELVRDAAGFCVPCAPGESGELLSALSATDSTGLRTFAGYHKDPSATAKKIAKDVFVKGDMYFRTGDLLKMSREGRFYFVDRIGDTFRWKGENVATTEVAEAVGRFPAFSEVNVYGAAIPGHDGRCGMAAVVLNDNVTLNSVDWDAVLAHCRKHLPSYAVPLFFRVLPASQMTATFKHVKKDLRDEGADPTRVRDPLLYLNHRSGKYEPLTDERWHDVIAGRAKM